MGELMKMNKQKLTLDRTATYRIKVMGALDERWLVWDEQIIVSVERDDDGPSVTVLTGVLDQALLHGLLRRLYALGIPLISVICLDFNR